MSVAQNVQRIVQMLEESAESVRMANSNIEQLENPAGKQRELLARFRLQREIRASDSRSRLDAPAVPRSWRGRLPLAAAAPIR